MKKLRVKKNPFAQSFEKPPEKPGNWLNDRWGIKAKHGLFSSTGTWYNLLTRFPGALCDPKGYIKFATKDDFEKSKHLNVGVEIDVPDGICKIPGFKMGDPPIKW